MDAVKLQERRKKIERGVKVGLFALAAVLGLGVMAPLIIAGVQAFVALVVAGAIGLTIVNTAPVLAMKFANWRLKAIKAEATKNPVETLQNEYSARVSALARFRDSINKFAASAESFADKLDGFKAAFPKDAPKFEDQLTKMRKLLEIRRKRYKEAQQQLELFDAEITRANAIWNMAQDAARLTAAAGMTDEDFFAKIKTETALESVSTAMNTAFAELETSLIEEASEKELASLEEEQVHRQAAAKKVAKTL